MTAARRHERLLYRFALRGAAFTIDLAIVAALSGVTSRSLSSFATTLIVATQNNTGYSLSEIAVALYLAGPAVGVVVALGVIVGSYRWLAASPGQLATGLSVADARTGDEPTGRQSLVRGVLLFGPILVALNLPAGLLPAFGVEGPDWVAIAIAGAPVLLLAWYPLLGYSVLVRPSGRGLHDRLTGTRVGWGDDDEELGSVR